jgi:putative tryptophan/tyrosine transport system substrate-binding protein
MKRREVIGFFGAAVAGWPFATGAQQPATPTIGFLSSRSAKESTELIGAFREGLSENGFVESRNVTIEIRWAEGHYDRHPVLCADLVSRQVAVIITTGVSGTLAAKSATTKIPIVFLTGVDPIQYGLVQSLSRPGGNLTGVSTLGNTLAPKQLEFLHEVVPRATRLAYLANPTNIITEKDVPAVKSAANATRLAFVVVNASVETGFDGAFTAMANQNADVLLVQSDPFFNSHSEQIVALAARYAIPAVYQTPDFARAGGLMSYGTALTEAYHQLGAYAGKILKGAKPADLPVQQAVRVELIINLKTAKALGVTIPQSMLSRADEVIQ